MNRSREPNNVVKFRPPDTIRLSINQRTWRRLKKLARCADKTTDEIINEALSYFVEQRKIGESLVAHLQRELDVCGAYTKRCALMAWQNRIEDSLQWL